MKMERIHTFLITFWRFFVLLAKKYINPIGTVTYTANFAISKIPFDVPKDDISLDPIQQN